MQYLMNKALKLFKPIVMWLGKMHFPYSHKRIKGVHYYKYRKNFKPGDVFLTSTRGEISNILNPSEIKHAGIFYGHGLKTAIMKLVNLMDDQNMAKRLVHMIHELDIDDDVTYVIEAIGKGVVVTDLVTFMTTKDRFVQVRSSSLYDYGSKAANNSLKYIGRGYDYQFEFDNESMYCFELCAQSYLDIDRELFDSMLNEVQMTKEKKIYDSSTFMEDNINWKIIIDSKEQE